MTSNRDVAYLEKDEYIIFSLNYDVEGMDMVFILPKFQRYEEDKFISLGNFLDRDTALSIVNILGDFNTKYRRDNVALMMFIFEAVGNNNVKKVIEKCGMGDMFENDNLNMAFEVGILSLPIIEQMTKIKVDAKGVTFVSCTESYDCASEPKELNLSRIFFYVIRKDGAVDLCIDIKLFFLCCFFTMFALLDVVDSI